MDAGRILAQDCPALLIDSLTGHYILTLVHIVLASGYPFLPSYGKGELWNAPSKCSMAQVCIATPTGNIPETSEVLGHLYNKDSLMWSQQCPYYGGSTLKLNTCNIWDVAQSTIHNLQSTTLLQNCFCATYEGLLYTS